MKNTVKWIENKSNIELLAIGIGHDVTRYYKKAVKITDVQDLGEVMINQLTNLFSEKKGESHIPLIFWYLSILGGIGLLTYAIFRKDPVIILGQTFGIFIYLRNLILIYKKRNEKN